jgi:hypothetical protein
MHVNAVSTSQAQGRWRALWRLAGFVSALSGLSACHDDPAGVGRSGGPVAFNLAASVNAAPGALVVANVSFTAPGAAARVLAADSISVNTGAVGAAATALTLSADVTACTASATAEAPCTLTLNVSLKRDGAVLDAASQSLAVTAATTELSPAPVQLFEVSSIRVTPSTFTGFEPGDSVALTAQPLDRNGLAVAARTVAWSVQSGGVTVSAAGMLKAVTVGAATVRASVGGRSQDVAVTVGPSTVASIDLAPADTLVAFNGTATYRATPRTAAGAAMTGVTLTYTSGNTSIASVSPAGVATGVGTGSTTITVRSTGGRGGATISATANFRVDAAAVLAVAPGTLNFLTEVGQNLPAAQTVAVSNSGGSSLGTISVVTPVDTLLTATLDRNTAPATLTIRPTTALQPGVVLTRTVSVRSSTPGVANATVTVTITGNQITAPGRFSGIVLNAATGQALSGATVTIRRADGSTADQVLTQLDGRWTTNPIPSGTYDLFVSATGYQTVQLYSQLLSGGVNTPVTPLTSLPLVPNGSQPGQLGGPVRNAVNNFSIQNATIELRSGAYNVTGTPIATTTSDVEGFYNFGTRPAGTYTIRATSAGFTAGVVIVTVVNGDAEAPVLFLSPNGVSIVWRFVLSWGAAPMDLDAHLTGPVPNSANRFHVYWLIPGSLTLSPFAQLDIDQQFGFGPETITIAQQFAGVYRYYVNNFSLESPLKSSKARVDVYQGSTLVRQYFPPQQDGSYWTVFEIDGTTINPINAIGSVQPLVTTPVGPFRSAGGASAANAVAEWLQLMPWRERKPPRSR